MAMEEGSHDDAQQHRQDYRHQVQQQLDTQQEVQRNLTEQYEQPEAWSGDQDPGYERHEQPGTWSGYQDPGREARSPGAGWQEPSSYSAASSSSWWERIDSPHASPIRTPMQQLHERYTSPAVHRWAGSNDVTVSVPDPPYPQRGVRWEEPWRQQQGQAAGWHTEASWTQAPADAAGRQGQWAVTRPIGMDRRGDGPAGGPQPIAESTR